MQDWEDEDVPASAGHDGVAQGVSGVSGLGRGRGFVHPPFGGVQLEMTVLYSPAAALDLGGEVGNSFQDDDKVDFGGAGGRMALVEGHSRGFAGVHLVVDAQFSLAHRVLAPVFGELGDDSHESVTPSGLKLSHKKGAGVIPPPWHWLTEGVPESGLNRPVPGADLRGLKKWG